ncbi:MAG: LysR family transcriptional regulator [Mogibacterium sp.]|nr:LysR family transcriptional regulator [Mogibacterium sp.]
MTLQELRYFCVTAEVLHYTRAAELLYISQPSLSYSLAKLERELDVPLFEKHGKKITLTKYGAEFLPYAKRALGEVSQGLGRLQELKLPSAGIINLGYIYSVSFSVLPEFVNKYYISQGSEQNAFRFHQGMAGALMEKLLNGSMDLLIAGETDISSVESIPIYRQELVLAVPASHRLAKRTSVSLSDLSEENFISINHDAVIYHQLESKFRNAEITPNTILEADEYSSIAASVTTGAGVAITPRLPILDNFNIKLIPFSDQSMTRDVCIIRSASYEMSPAVKSVWDFAKQLSEEHAIH